MVGGLILQAAQAFFKYYLIIIIEDQQLLEMIEMESTDYKLGQLVPRIIDLLSGGISPLSAEGLSAIIVLILFSLLITFLVIALLKFDSALIHLKFYEKLLKGLTSEQLLGRQRELKNTALENKKYGDLWREFDESLVHSLQRNQLCNTLDAAHFFNTHTIAKGLTENRMLAAVPGFLTAIGVLGTFGGLQLGLGPLSELGTAGTSSGALSNGIFTMIGGASIAFMTSVWGVITSLVFNFVEKMLERYIRSRISSFQNRVDYLYPRITAEQSLSKIEDFTRQSNDRLAELDEKIGHKMQEAMREASTVISESVMQSLNTILGPAIERLVDNAHSGSEKAFESLLERFLQGVGTAGDTQKIVMEQTAKEISTVSSDMKTGLQELVSGLEKQMNNITENSTATLSKISHVVSQQMEEQQERDVARQSVLQTQLRDFQTSQERVTEGIDSTLASQKEQNTELMEGLRNMLSRFEQLSTSHQAAAEAMQASSVEMKAGSNQLGLLSANLKTTTDLFGEQLSKALDSAEKVTQTNADTAVAFGQVLIDLSATGDKILTASDSLKMAADKADGGLNAVGEHFDSLGRSLENHISAIQQQVAELLKDYSERVQTQTVSRLSTWNEQTNNYISSMTDAVRALSSVVDEIEGKVTPRKEGHLG